MWSDITHRPSLSPSYPSPERPRSIHRAGKTRLGQTDGNTPSQDADPLSNVSHGYSVWTSTDATPIKFMNVVRWRCWKAACWETRTCSLGEGSRKSTTFQWQLVGFLSYITYIRLT